MEVRDALDARQCFALRATRSEISLAHEEVELDLDVALVAIASGSVPRPFLATSPGASLLLAGYEDLSPLFQEWVTTARRSTEERLAAAFRCSYENPAISRLARRKLAEASLRLDQLDEAACRAVMRLAAEDGEIGVALRAYDALYEVLGADLDMEPSEATQALVVEIKQGRFQANARHPDVDSNAWPPPRSRSYVAQSGVPVVAVLPLYSIGPASTLTSCIAEGIVDDVVRILAGLREPVVISSNSTRNFRGLDLNMQSVGEALGAQYLVSGSARVMNDQTRIAVELIDASTSAVLWSNVFAAPHAKLLELQEQIAAGIANTLVPQLNAVELRRSRQQQWEELGAYHLLLRARDLVFNLDRPAFDQAGVLLRQAVEIDPDYATLHAALADWYSLRVFQGWSIDPSSDVLALEKAARTAINLDPCHARALALLGHNRTLTGRKYQEAKGLFERALNAAPNDAEAWMWSSPTFAYTGQASEAIARAEKALSLSPYDPFLFRYEHFLCIAHYAAGDLEQAAHWGQRSLASNVNYTSNLRMTAAALAGLGRIEEAKPLVRAVMELEPHFSVSSFIVHQAFDDEGQRNLYGQRLVLAGLPK
jgi:TolB-like protein/Tfp pilus assembly protein PilF